MRRPVRPFLFGASALLVVSALALVGCDDPKSLEWQVKHLADSNPIDRSRAIEGVAQGWRAIDQSAKPDAPERKEFKDKAVEALAAAYTSDLLKESSKDRKKIMDILSQADDKRAKPAFVHAIKNYKPGDNDDETKAATRSIVKNKADFQGDNDVGSALVAALKSVKFADRRSGELGAMFGDALSAIKATGQKSDVLAIVTAPNDGQDTVPNKELAGRQAIAAQALGDIADASMVNQMIDAMFEHASKLARRKDLTTGDEIEQASPLTTAVSMILGGSIAKLGEPAIAPLMPFVKDDAENPKVKEVKAKFAKYISPGGSGKPTAYVDIATTTVANIGLPKVSQEIAGIVRDKKTKDSDRKALIGLLVSLPADETVMAAIKEGFSNAGSDKLKTDIAASASRLMEKEMTEWLLQIVGDAKAGDDLKTAALGSALWLAPKDKLAAVRGGYDKAKLLDKRDPLWKVMEPSDKECDPKAKLASKEQQCEPHPEKKAKDGKGDLYVLWNDNTPKYADELKIVEDLVNGCDQDAKCYFKSFQESVKEVDKQGFTKVTAGGTLAGIKMQKAIWMLAVYGKEDDMVDLVKFVPTIQQPAARSFVQMALDKNLHNGSAKVADAIAKLVKSEREKGSETANREASQLEPIANKLRARLASAGGAKK
jgi:hypothetical protein